MKEIIPHASRILDVGCGRGDFLVSLQEICGATRISGVDVSAGSVAEARRRGIDAQVVDVGSEALPYPDSSFDLVYCGQVIEHVFDPDHLLTEIQRAIGRNGVLVLDTPNLASWYNRLSLLFGYQPFAMDVSPRHNVGKLLQFGDTYEGGAGGHIRVFTKRALEQLLLLHSFKIIKVHGAPLIEPVYTTLPHYWYRIESLFSQFSSVSGCVIIAARKTL